MNWDALVRLPTTLLLILAVLGLLFTLVQLVRLRGHVHERRHAAAAYRGTLVLLGLCLTLILALGGLTLRGYRLLNQEVPVLDVDAHILSPQRFALTLTWPDGITKQVLVAGDAFRVEAIIAKWKAPAMLAGIPPLYRLDRVDGRYDDAAQEVSAPRTVTDFNQAGQLDLVSLAKQRPWWLPQVDTVYGSGAFLPLIDEGHYSVSLMRSGALVARPDDATQQRLSQRM